MDFSGFDAYTGSALLVAVSEIGDKTQLLSFSLAAKYQRPLPILSGILVATLVNHALAAWAGQELSGFFAPKTTALVLGAIFIACAFWALVPDKLDEPAATTNRGAFWSTMILFFLAEMGDKTQVATASLGARYQSVLWVTLGTTTGMMVTDGFAVMLGDRLAKHVQAKWIRYCAAALFFIFGVVSLISAQNL